MEEMGAGKTLRVQRVKNAVKVILGQSTSPDTNIMAGGVE